MSFVRFKPEAQLETESSPVAAVSDASKVSMRIDVVQIPSGTADVKQKINKETQTNAIKSIQQLGKDLFMENKTVVSTQAGKRLYQTADLFGQVLSIEQLIPMLTDNGLTLRVNALREGYNAHATCMELTSGKLADLLEEAADSKREKVTELSIPTGDDKGKMYVGIKLSNGSHYIQKLDYEISTQVDDSLHVK